MKFSKEFKEAISHLPEKEKDKLLIRLLKKDPILAQRLEFELIDDLSVDERRALLADDIETDVKRFSEYSGSIGYLTMDIRYLSGYITKHVKITKDKFGEVSLNILMLTEVLQHNNQRIQQVSLSRARKLLVSIIARAFKIVVLTHKLDDDFLIELEKPLNQLGNLIGENDYLMRTAIQNGFDVNWLLSAKIPEDIVEIHKEIRQQGLLK
ncbi:MAG: hypothetical protein LAT51_06010 [Flavobacteriaceae bacterium]|nr:hypothetical protein [Flavobacteriaceae bacterium]